MSEIVKNLLKIVFAPQKSKEWFNLRNTRITGSNATCCLVNCERVLEDYNREFNIEKPNYNNKCCNSYDSKEEFIIQKCKAFRGENVFNDTIFTMWGKKYEEIATRFYRKKFQTPVYEFGLLLHPEYDFLGASPDGITPEGVMLEIKCPYSRKVGGPVPFTYWAQMQLQLEVANLDICHYLECEIVENIETDIKLSEEQSEEPLEQFVIERELEGTMGILLQNPDTQEYIYPPDFVIDFNEWKRSYPENFIVSHWKIEKTNLIVIKRNKQWFQKILPDLRDTHTFFRYLQENPEAFRVYLEEYKQIKNKKYFEKYNETVCLLD